LGTSEVASEIDGVVLLSGPSVGILEIMREQLQRMTPPDALDDAIRGFDAGLAYIRRGETMPPDVAAHSSLRALAAMNAGGLEYMRECDATDPAKLAAELPQPVLIVQGGRDTSVPRHHADKLRDVRDALGDRHTSFGFFPEVQHMYKVVPDDVPPMEA